MASGNQVETSNRELTDAEREEFLKDNHFGILSFAGDKPYGLPIGYIYRKGTFILGLQTPGRKMDYLRKNRNVSYTICKPIFQTGLKESCTTVVVEGELEDVPDRAYYGLDKEIPEMPENLKLFTIKVNKLSTRKCTNIPCRIYTTEGWVSDEVFARRLHEGRIRLV